MKEETGHKGETEGNGAATGAVSLNRHTRRLAGLDAHRGLLMALMAIDHASMFVARAHSVEFWGATLPVYPDAIWFWTRWITHICAPGFFFLMGVGMILLSEARRAEGWSEGRVLRFFVVRGVILAALQVLAENPAWAVGFLFAQPGLSIIRGGPVPGGGGEATYLGVLFSLGGALIFWAFLISAPSRIIGMVSLAAVMVTQFVTPGPGDTGTLYSPLIRVLLIPGHTNGVMVFYPIVPWLGVCGLGLIFGRILTRQADRAGRYAFWTAMGLLLLFLILRIFGGFGNLNVAPQGWMGFLNVVKYPPSLSFLAVTLAMNLLLVAAWGRAEGSLRNACNPLLVFGRAALFFYIIHLWLYALLGIFFPRGGGLPALYCVWLLGLIILMPLCCLYNRLKMRTEPASLWRFF